MSIKIPATILRHLFRFLDFITPFADLAARVWISKVFFQSGLTKISDWQTTIMLFTNQYQVPFLPPVAAAYIGTGFELVLPVLLVLGLGGRFSIFLFFVYNLMCVISFHFLWTTEGKPGLDDHICWGLILLLLMCHGLGKISLDHLIRKRWGHHLEHST